MYRCVYCFVPVALSWAPSHLCLKNFNFLHVDEYSLVTGHEGTIKITPHNNNEEAVCVSAELQVDKHWTTVVTYMEMNTDILTDQAVDGPFNRSCAKNNQRMGVKDCIEVCSFEKSNSTNFIDRNGSYLL
ncbi:uncharacterized protein [Venturia canescens]|uniref:uncharacterized protein n=1 Tax=Venturia canescens TaxID=32260 RepID=UPI001C9D1718|nr:uncharacterized protein LOC122406080 [Venturia canescens]XP_043267233.1 uncharacterized protein LOC122406080 [Venturia canescens]